MEETTMTKKLYNQPEVQVAHIESSALMNPGSANITMDQGSTINPEQW
jgi:hypothetical protein